MSERDTTNDYIDNEKLLDEIRKYREEYLKSSDDPPQLPEYIGECIIMIAENIANRPNFRGYTYIDEMKQDGILHAVKAIRNFDPDKSSNPFGYLSMVIWRAFLQRRKIEKRESAKKHKSLLKHHFDAIVDPEFGKHINDVLDDEKAYEYIEDEIK